MSIVDFKENGEDFKTKYNANINDEVPTQEEFLEKVNLFKQSSKATKKTE